jgi:hypothetical protein
MTMQSTIKIILQGVDQYGHFSASLPDGTALVRSSRQPFLDAARVLVASGFDADSRLEGWWPEATTFALRARLCVAARLRVLEKSGEKPRFSLWTPYGGARRL